MNKMKALAWACAALASACGPTKVIDLAAVAQQVAPVFQNCSTCLAYDDGTAYGGIKLHLGEILGDPAGSVPITNLFKTIESAEDAVNEVAAQVKANGCTAIPAGTTIHTPWFDDNSQMPFFGSMSSWPFTCQVAPTARNHQTSSIGGRVAVASPPSSCRDPYTYYTMSAWHEAGPNAEDVAVRGDSKTIDVLVGVSFNQCTQDLQVAVVHCTIYSADVRFCSRSELSGSAATHDFRYRIISYDRENGGTAPNDMFFQSEGRGVSRTATTGGAHFITTASLNNSNNLFCLEVSPGFSYSAVNTGCAGYEADFAGITRITSANMPQNTFPLGFGF